MEDVAGIIVEGEDRTISIPAVANIPLFHLAAGSIHTELIILSTGFCQHAFDGGGKEEPVGVGRINLAHALELLDIALLCHIVEWHPKGVPGAEERLGDVGGINEILPSLAPTEIIRGIWVYGILIGGQCPLTELTALLPLGSIIIRKGKPRGDAGHQSAKGLHIDHGSVTVVERG